MDRMGERSPEAFQQKACKESVLKMIRLIAVDMDGTMLNDDSEITNRTKAAVQKAASSDVLFVVATGRAMRGVEDINRLFEKDLPFITLNGAFVVMGKTRKVLMNKRLDMTLAKEVYDLGHHRDIPMVIWTGERFWASRECEAISNYGKIYDMDYETINNLDDLGRTDISKLLWFGTPESITRYSQEMNIHFAGRLNCHASRPKFLEFVGSDTDKGSALAEIGKIYGIESSEMIAVGDSYNDISMLKYAGLGIAMENAADEVKAVCGQTTQSNNNDGVAAVIEEYVLG